MIARHWDASSELYTGVDSLVTALEVGWVMNKLFRQEAFQSYGGLVTVYYFELERAGEMVEMAVVNNPYMRQFLAQSDVQTADNLVLVT